MSTIFNKIINKEIPADIIYENETVLCFKDINPIAPIHLLIIPKKEIPTVNDIKNDDKELMGDLFIAAKEVAKLLKIDKNGYRLIINCNEDGCQTVYHLHIHLIAGKKLGWRI